MFSATFWHEITLYAIDIDKKRVRTPFLALSHIIFQENYRSYEHALKQANLKTLRQRRILLMNNFAKKASKSERFNKWFVVESNEEGKSTRTKKTTRLLRQIPCRTQRYERSSLPYMTKLLSWHPPLPAPDLSMK